MSSQRVFLSHAGEERSVALEIAKRLRQLGFTVWLDVDNIKPGERWMNVVESALKEADIFALYLAQNASNRWVGFELRAALARSVQDTDFKIVPLLAGVDPNSIHPFLAQYQAIDLTEGLENLGRLSELTDTAAPPASRRVPGNRLPFRGLLPFDAETALYFFGRDREVEDVLSRLERRGFVAIIGHSGSGKSSLLRAGLLPALHDGRLAVGPQPANHVRTAICRPGDNPFRELANAILELEPTSSPAARIELRSECARQLKNGTEGLYTCISSLVPPRAITVLLVDQFEEIFDVCIDADERSRFIESLIFASRQVGDHPVKILIALRADFYSHCFHHPELTKLLVDGQIALQPMTRESLRDVIEKPLLLAGTRIEPGLVDTLLDDANADVGSLPLLQHTLLQLWERRTADQITHSEYMELGRLAGALEHYAEGLFNSLPDRDKERVTSILLRLVQPGEGAENRRIRVKKSDILEGRSEETERVLKILVDARLVTSGQTVSGGEFVEIAHEALLYHWPRLRSLIDASRDDLRVEHRLLAAATDWLGSAKDVSLLYFGSRLEQALEWAQRHPDNPTAVMREFLEASVAARNQAVESQRLESIGKIAGNIAHEFNNLLMVIQGYGDLIYAKLPANHELKLGANELLVATTRAAILTRQLLTFGRRRSTNPKTIDVAKLLKSMNPALTRDVGAAIELTLLTETAPVLVRADPGQLSEIITLLVSSARGSIKARGRITVECSLLQLGEDYARSFLGLNSGAYAVLSVSDSGSSINDEDRKHLFDPFFSSSKLGRGTGLGLAEVYGIVKQADGSIWVENSPMGGMTVKVYLPGVPLPTILVVDDEPIVLNLVNTYLVPLGYTVLLADSGPSALEVLSHSSAPPDLLIADLVMKPMSGRELASAVLSIHGGTKVLYISGGDTRLSEAEYRSLPLLEKPFTRDQVTTTVGQILGFAL